MISVVIVLGFCVFLCSGANLRADYSLLKGDKVFDDGSKYSPHNQTVHGDILSPMLEIFAFRKKTLKILAIGSGSDVSDGPVTRRNAWTKIIEGRDVELWEADFDERCVKMMSNRTESKMDAIKTVADIQAESAGLAQWIEEIRGKFDVVVDDGGHSTKKVMSTFAVLWPHINLDGNYFISNQQVAFTVMQAWVTARHVGEHGVSQHHIDMISLYPLPEDLDRIFCQQEVCVLRKAPARK